MTNHSKDDLNTMLSTAVKENKIWDIKRLIELGADVNVQDSTGNTLLHYAVNSIIKSLFSNDHDKKNIGEHIVETLIEAGADVNSKDSQGRTILHNIVMVGQQEEYFINKLLEYFEAKVNPIDQEGRTPLYYATINNKKYMKLLIDAGAKVDITDDYGRTILHHLAYYTISPI